MHRPHHLLWAMCVVSIPWYASAQVISEIMYNPPGADTNSEWIEILNNATSSVDLTKYSISEGGTHHRVLSYMGTSTLAPGASAIIARDPVTVAKEYNGIGVLLKSAISLSNTGESIQLLSKNSVSIDLIQYTTTLGANGDGNSLHRVGDSLVTGAPDPGVYTATPPAPLRSSSANKPVRATTHEPPVARSTPAPNPTQPNIPVQPTQSPEDTPGWVWVAGLVALITCGVAASMYVTRGTKSDLHEFDLDI